MIYGIAITMALVIGGAIGLLLAVARYHSMAMERRRYEQEVARDGYLRAAATQAALRRYSPTWPRN
jgi:hypothetical protein